MAKVIIHPERTLELVIPNSDSVLDVFVDDRPPFQVDLWDEDVEVALYSDDEVTPYLVMWSKEDSVGRTERWLLEGQGYVIIS